MSRDTFILDPHLEIYTERECERIQSETGDYPIDWMTEVAEDAQISWTEDGFLDYDSAEFEITEHADTYINFIRENYPEDMPK